MAASAVRRRSCRGLQTLLSQFRAVRRRFWPGRLGRVRSS